MEFKLAQAVFLIADCTAQLKLDLGCALLSNKTTTITHYHQSTVRAKDLLVLWFPTRPLEAAA